MTDEEEEPALQLVNKPASRMKLSLTYELVDEVGAPYGSVHLFTFAVKSYTHYLNVNKLKKLKSRSRSIVVWMMVCVCVCV